MVNWQFGLLFPWPSPLLWPGGWCTAECLSAGTSPVVRDGYWSCPEHVPWTAWLFPTAGGNSLLTFFSCCSVWWIHLQEPCKAMWMKMHPVSEVMCPWYFFFQLSREILLAHATHWMSNLHIAVLHWLHTWYVAVWMTDLTIRIFLLNYVTCSAFHTVCRVLSSEVCLLK